MSLDIDTAKLVKDFQDGNETVFADLCEKYKPLMLAMINRIILSSFPGSAGSENDVFMQEATMALYNAAKTFDAEQSGVTFGLYAKICIRNRLVSVKRKLVGEQKKKNRPGQPSAKTEGKAGASHNKRQILADVDRLSKVIEDELSEFEKKIFSLYLENLSYGEIAECLSISKKSVDNALYRIRCKIKSSM